MLFTLFQYWSDKIVFFVTAVDSGHISFLLQVCESVPLIGAQEKWYYRLGRQSAADFKLDSSHKACVLTYTGTNQKGTSR